MCPLPAVPSSHKLRRVYAHTRDLKNPTTRGSDPRTCEANFLTDPPPASPCASRRVPRARPARTRPGSSSPARRGVAEADARAAAARSEAGPAPPPGSVGAAEAAWEAGGGRRRPTCGGLRGRARWGEGRRPAAPKAHAAGGTQRLRRRSAPNARTGYKPWRLESRAREGGDRRDRDPPEEPPLTKHAWPLSTASSAAFANL